MVAEHLCGWARSDDPAPGDPLWPTVADAVARAHAAARATARRGSRCWRSSPPAWPRPAGEPLGPPTRTRVCGPARCAVPAAYVDGPRAHNSGGWYMFIGGLPGDRWVMEYGESPAEAARRALLQAEAMLEERGVSWSSCSTSP